MRRIANMTRLVESSLYRHDKGLLVVGLTARCSFAAAERLLMI